MSVLVWVMVGIAVWHFTVLVPDYFWGGIVGALLVALAGALLSGYLLPAPGVPTGNPPGLMAGVWAVPGSVGALWLSYVYGRRVEAERDG